MRILTKANRRMEKRLEKASNTVFDMHLSELAYAASEGLMLSPKDAEEFRAYKRKKKIDEIMSAMSKSESSLLSGDDVPKVCERALRLKQAAVKTTVSYLAQVRALLKNSRVKADVLVGGFGETLTRVKVYEARLALRMQAKELTFVPSSLSLSHCRFEEVRRELRVFRRASGKTTMKVYVDGSFSPTTLSRVARIAGEVGAEYFCVPYYAGCERLRYELTGGCKLEVCAVETAETCKRLLANGVGRITTERIWEIYNEWMKEADKLPEYQPIVPRTGQISDDEEIEKLDCAEMPSEELPSGETVKIGDAATLRCGTDGSDLKFL